MNNFLRKRWAPFTVWALIIFLLSSNANPLFGLDKALRSVSLLGNDLSLFITLFLQVFNYTFFSVFLIRALAWKKVPGALLLLMVFSATILFALANEGYQSLLHHRGFLWRNLVMGGWGALFGLIGYVLWPPSHSDPDEETNLLL